MSFNHRTCAGQQTGAKPRPQEPVVVAFVNLTGAAQQDLQGNMTQQRATYISVITVITTTRLWKHKY